MGRYLSRIKNTIRYWLKITSTTLPYVKIIDPQSNQKPLGAHLVYSQGKSSKIWKTLESKITQIMIITKINFRICYYVYK